MHVCDFHDGLLSDDWEKGSILRRLFDCRRGGSSRAGGVSVLKLQVSVERSICDCRRGGSSRAGGVSVLKLQVSVERSICQWLHILI